MTFDDILAQLLDLLQRQGRVSYRALKLRFDIGDDYIEGLKDELIYAQQVASDIARIGCISQEGELLENHHLMHIIAGESIRIQDQHPLDHALAKLVPKSIESGSVERGATMRSIARLRTLPLKTGHSV